MSRRGTARPAHDELRPQHHLHLDLVARGAPGDPVHLQADRRPTHLGHRLPDRGQRDLVERGDRHVVEVGLAGESANAVDVVIDLSRALRTLPDAFNAAPRHPVYAHVEMPHTLHLVVVSEGDWPSSVPLECRIGARISFPPDWPVKRAQGAVNDAVEQYAVGDRCLSTAPPRVRWHGFRAHGFAIEAERPLVALLTDTVKTVTGAPMFVTGDARYLVDEGIAAICFAPAGGGMPDPDEWVDLASAHRVAQVLACTVVTWSGTGRQD
ncbi:MAG: hypothetical protein M3171_11780 [Actinomycetota bacterium]|nr:hypothetical protein [Actinomycetota bacterium]